MWKFVSQSHKNIVKTGALSGVALLALLALGSCNKDETIESQFLGPIDGVIGLNTFYGEVDNTLTTSCGTATAATSSGSSTSTGDSGSSGGSSSTPTSYKIVSYYTFNNDLSGFTLPYTGNLLLKYTYYTDRDTFSMAPTSSSTTTCTTSDNINCDSTGSFTCETADNITCGGTEAFIFTRSFNVQQSAYTFTATTGTLDWSKGYNLNDGKSAVSSANLKFSMISSDGSVFIGEVNCVSTQQ